MQFDIYNHHITMHKNKEYQKINTIIGWIIFAIASYTYLSTREAGISFWDCGEFVSCSYKLQVSHPPGAPFFILMGRIFILLFGNNPHTVATAVNSMSGLSGGFAMMFLFWIITHWANKIVKKDNLPYTSSEWVSIMGAGVIGALAFTWSDTIWFSMVEGIVFSMAQFFSVLILWLMVKWENRSDEPNADRWIILCFFCFGLAVGVHVLTLLVAPCIILIYFYKRRKTWSHVVFRKNTLKILWVGGGILFLLSLLMENSAVNPDKGIGFDSTYSSLIFMGVLIIRLVVYLIERKYKNNIEKKEKFVGLFFFFFLSCIITGGIYVFVMRYTVLGGGYFDLFFVNNFHLPFFSGYIVFFIILIAFFFYIITLSVRKKLRYLYLLSWIMIAVLTPFVLSYLITMLRANAEPSINMYKVDNPITLVSYLGRDQYGEIPHVYSQTFVAQPVDIKPTGTRYEKGSNGEYIVAGKNYQYVYLPEDKMVFPRLYDPSNDQGHADYYAYFLGYGKDKDGHYVNADGSPIHPTQKENISFFLGYQTYFMYIRYLLWNYAGRQDDLQGLFIGNGRDGNWITGMNALDGIFLGNQNFLPHSILHDKGRTIMLALPFILGLIGLFFHFKNTSDEAIIVLFYILFTGIALTVYLNMPGYQPRERDYAFESSVGAFAIWIGLGFLKVRLWLQKYFSALNAAIVAFIVCLLLVPILMVSQEWKSHDRSKKLLPGDIARDYLNSCPPNAILFTFGDNDTYPLWFEQEVENVRPDIRIINFSLLGVDWYINQLRRKVNESDAIDVLWAPEQIQGDKLNYAQYQPNAQLNPNQYYDLKTILNNYIANQDPTNYNQQGAAIIPTLNLSIPVDTNLVRRNGTINPNDSVVSNIQFKLSKTTLLKNDLAVLAIIAANHWRRPICFTSPYTGSDGVGLDSYIRRDGMTYQLVPVFNSAVNTNAVYNLLMNHFRFGSADIPGVYFDETNRGTLNSMRQLFAIEALDLIDKNKIDSARKVLEVCDKHMLVSNFPYGMASRNNMQDRVSIMFMEAACRANDIPLAKKIYQSLNTDLKDQIKYIQSLDANRQEMMSQDFQAAQQLSQYVDGIQQTFKL